MDHWSNEKVKTLFLWHKIVAFNNIFVVGGLNGDNWCNLDTVYHYNIAENVWNKLNIKMPNKLRSFGCTTAINNKYILIFGGMDNGYNNVMKYIYFHY